MQEKRKSEIDSDNTVIENRTLKNNILQGDTHFFVNFLLQIKIRKLEYF